MYILQSKVFHKNLDKSVLFIGKHMSDLNNFIENLSEHMDKNYVDFVRDNPHTLEITKFEGTFSKMYVLDVTKMWALKPVNYTYRNGHKPYEGKSEGYSNFSSSKEELFINAIKAFIKSSRVFSVKDVIKMREELDKNGSYIVPDPKNIFYVYQLKIYTFKC